MQLQNVKQSRVISQRVGLKHDMKLLNIEQPEIIKLLRFRCGIRFKITVIKLNIQVEHDQLLVVTDGNTGILLSNVYH